MPFHIKTAESESDYRDFIRLPFRLYRYNKYWVPPLRSDEWELLQPATNPYQSCCESRYWLAYSNNKCVGRIGAMINHVYNEKSGEKLGRITRFESINENSVAGALLFSAEQWLKEKGTDGVLGPLGFSNLDLQGLLVEGFHQLPSIASSYHHPYYQDFFEAFGYSKEIDWVEFRLTIGKTAVEKANRGAQLIRKRHNIHTIHFKTSQELTRYADTIFTILNDSFSDLPFVTPFTKEQAMFYSRKYLRLLNPEFVKVVACEGEPIGFIVGMPSLSQAMQKANGKLFPFGFYHLVRARKGKDTMDQLLTGVKKQYQSTGAAVVLMAELQDVMLKKGMKYIETTGIFETNHSAIGNWKNYDHIQHKRRRCYRKMFNT